MGHSTLYNQHREAFFRVCDAVGENQVEQVRSLLEATPLLSTLRRYNMDDGESLLHLAAASGSREVCALLVSLGMDIDLPLPGYRNHTPLSEAAGHGHVDTCRWLLDHGAAVDGLPDNILSPLDSACVDGHQDVVALLLQRGANPNRLHTRWNQAPVDIAAGWGFPAIVQMLATAGGVSILDVPQQAAASPQDVIRTFMHHSAGWVLPAVFSPDSGDARFSLGISCIGGKREFKLLFTVGLFQQSPMTELAVCLPTRWPLTVHGFAEHSPWRFPVALLARLGRRTLDQASLAAGELLRRDDPYLADLAWPDGVDALLAIDKRWNPEPEEDDVADDDKVTIYLLVPVAYTKKGAPGASTLPALMERKLKGSWKVSALPFAIPR
ncbi:ankyrin repeat domain-containing protein [Janthinobacterium sp. FW305-128]|uniref:ankyrin repeat domain-containing protein n=1 Tax=Janthinobacterium sp. FW305-128 TaxID=2775055 RepID=UPI001E5A4D89|nr:ankyrin repeat domain-containing protein [Janthinobacterium sp. FW305-128]MCC7681270.1 ankyrin repeat domain-containing protein [Janthinobacterium sp. FW305-128]